ncbi:golgin subfamily A member 2 isoform X2 [Manduca sexta]|uniref:Golgin subfamily A conserved domain-containing protein n=1 Tax=Manduca sexta TaxID=7130 RepID=A0A921YV05_MANSE|nr:golgin subfamily A member 2 isoform X2 [Manduca sexta]KAG6446218.1 hypothetical protein O3G_MSEX004381 [Manduca sexta]
MDDRAAKLALARKKLKDHQVKKSYTQQRDVNCHNIPGLKTNPDNVMPHIINEEQVQPMFSTESRNDNTIQNINSEVADTKQTIVNSPTLTDSLNATEFLISSKRNLEIQVDNLQSKLADLQDKYTLALTNDNASKQIIQNLERDLRNIEDKYNQIGKEILEKNDTIKELHTMKTLLSDENSNYQEQLEFTKSILTAKEAENNSLHSQLFNLQNQLEATQLQLQQLTNGTVFNLCKNKTDETQQNEVLMQKILILEQQLKDSQKERNQISVHYEHYVSELNEQLKSVLEKNENLSAELQYLANRENSLIEQISEMEIRYQNYHIQPKATADVTPGSNDELQELQTKYEEIQNHFQALNIKYKELEKQCIESNEKIKELSQHKDTSSVQDTISISKLNADIASDKIAAQRATEQNKKLKQDMQGLEDAYVKMSKDKLDLTEKLTAEKYLNRQLTIKLAEIEEKTKDMQVKLKAKDEEMIRLQASYRKLEKYESSQTDKLVDNYTDNVIEYEELKETHSHNEECVGHQSDGSEEKMQRSDVMTPEILCNSGSRQSPNIAREDAMQKLQQRFLKIMEEVADLSDEKHRLEHIILQLQNETETICEYVALYQQQRSLLKRRDEERSAQIKIFEAECDKLKKEIDELTSILVKLSQDKDLSHFLKTDSKNIDIQRVMNLLSNLQSNSLIDPHKKNVDFKNFYPCNCCSGKLIEV